MDVFRQFTDPEPLNRNAIDALVRLSIIALLIYWAALLIQPFLVLIIWSVILVIVLYPAYAWSMRRLHLPSAIAAGAIVAFCLVILLGPATWLGLSLGSSLRWLAQRLASGELAIPPPFEAVRKWPLIGTKAYELWSLASTNFTEALVKVGPGLRPLSARLLVVASSAGLSMVKFVISVIIAGFLFKPGPSLVKSVGSVFRRLTTEHGDEYVELVGISVRNLARGVIGVALLQSLLVGIGLIVAGVPGAGLISLSVLILAIIQIGSAVVIIPVVIWSFFTMDTLGAVLFASYMVPVGLIDNFLRPIVMARGLKTPMSVILIGLLGGVWVHGLIGLFVGPIVLAITWELLGIWLWQGTNKTKSSLAAAANK
ncbi:MAG TPA: AI-2E family transporter [Xanthobacteraceae bacterium]|jgi:predicted PurR-regulated permease PerM